MSYTRFHWRAYNLLRRLFGLAALAGGAVFLWSAASLWLGLRPPEPGESTSTGYAYVAGAALGLLLGGLTVRLRPYRRDQGDISAWAGRAGGYPDASRAFGGEPRSWWTGEYRDEPAAGRRRAPDT